MSSLSIPKFVSRLEAIETSFAGSRRIPLAYAPNRGHFDVLRCVQGAALEIYGPNVVQQMAVSHL
jgi:hypothetical protein